MPVTYGSFILDPQMAANLVEEFSDSDNPRENRLAKKLESYVSGDVSFVKLNNDDFGIIMGKQPRDVGEYQGRSYEYARLPEEFERPQGYWEYGRKSFIARRDPETEFPRTYEEWKRQGN